MVNRITLQDINLAIPVLQQFNACKSFELTLKKFFCSDISSKSDSNRVLELLLLSVTIQPTEAIAETIESVVESAVKTLYMGNSPEKDMFLQAELFVRFNGPHILNADPFLRRVAHHLSECGDERGKVRFQTDIKGLLNVI